MPGLHAIILNSAERAAAEPDLVKPGGQDAVFAAARLPGYRGRGAGAVGAILGGQAMITDAITASRLARANPVTVSDVLDGPPGWT